MHKMNLSGRFRMIGKKWNLKKYCYNFFLCFLKELVSGLLAGDTDGKKYEAVSFSIPDWRALDAKCRLRVKYVMIL